MENFKSPPQLHVSGFLKNELKMMKKMFDDAPVIALILEGSEHYIRYSNKYFRELMGNRTIADGVPVRELLKQIRTSDQDVYDHLNMLDQVRDTGKAVLINEYMLTYDRYDTGNPEPAFFNIICQPLEEDEYGQETGIFIAGYEITDQVKTLKTSLQNKRRLEVILEAAKIGFWEFNLETEQTEFISSRDREMWGFPPKDLYSLEDFMAVIDSADRQNVRDQLKKAVDENKFYEAEYRVPQPGAPPRWLMSRGQCRYNEQGQPHSLMGVTIDITERKTAENQLEEALKIREDFIAIASHELQTPITGVKARVDLLKRRLAGSGQKQLLGEVEKIIDGIDELSRLNNQLLEISRLPAEIALVKEPFMMYELLKETVDSIQPVTTHTIEIHDEENKAVYADPYKVKQVLINLLDNALKYSPHADKVIIRTRVHEDKMVTSVSDFGVGIPVHERKKVFERFFKGCSPKKNTFPGFGVGLYIASQIVKQHDGKIWIEDNNGMGTTSSFSIPLAK